MAEIQKLFQITSLPGVQRDGTMLDANFYTDGQWVRFQRGRPRKMGGYRQISNTFAGPVRQSLVWTRGLMNALYSFSSSGIQMMLIDSDGSTGGLYNRTPVGFTQEVNHIWSVGTMYDDAVGSQNTIVVAVATNSLANIDDPTDKQVYFGVANSTAAFEPIVGLQVSGGVVCIAPYLVYFGNDGLVGWSNVNEPQTLATGDAGQDRVTGAKIVAGLPVRSANGPGALLWSLDSVISMQYIGGSAIFKFSTISAQSSILSQNSVIEYDNDYFWVGVDRFMVYTGGAVRELPNNHNLNWFFDNLNYSQRQKVWAMKVPRYGEIHWYFPFGDAEECTHCVIYNVREKTWYDNRLARSAGYYSQVFKYPVMMDASPELGVMRLSFTVNSGNFAVGDSVVSITSGGTFVLLQEEGGGFWRVQIVNQSTPFLDTEGLNNLSQVGTATLNSSAMIHSGYVHEVGTNAIIGETESAIESYFVTSDFGYTTGGAQDNQISGENRLTRLVRVEPDFKMQGSMSLEVSGRMFAQGTDITSLPILFDASTEKLDMREQRRLIRLKFTSNELNATYEMGRVVLHLEPGDARP